MDIELPIPNNWSHESIVALVERVFGNLTQEPVGVEYVSPNRWGAKRTQYIAVNNVGETFQKRHVNDRLGYYETTFTRTAVRDELIVRLS